MAARRPSPSDRVRAIVAREAGPEVAARLPRGYHRMGRVLLLRLPPGLEAHDATIGSAWQRSLGVATVLAQVGPIDGEARRPRLRRLAGTETTTEVIEHGIRYRFDAAETMFATGNRTERQRIATLVRPGETVADLFAGIGYFAVPIAARARPARLVAVEKNPAAHRYLVQNLAPYAARVPVEAVLGDNRTVDLPRAAFDRLLLGYLPRSDPWIPRALALARPEGAWLHVHRVADARAPLAVSAAMVAREIEEAGAAVVGAGTAREVKPYGPGRRHVVVDVYARPGRS